MQKEISFIYFVGGHATGKTTLARYTSKTYGFSLITEVARKVLAETEDSIPRLRTDIPAINAFQQAIFDRQLADEAKVTKPVVSDRSFDNLAYAAEHSTVVGKIMRSSTYKNYMKAVRENGLVFFIRPCTETMVNDGTREPVDPKAIYRIDGMIKLMLEENEIRYLPIESTLMQERVRAVEFVFEELLGISPGDQSGSKLNTIGTKLFSKENHDGPNKQ